ncbi:MAG: valine--tRNA ligase, partial [Acidobacteria bacterium]
LGIEFMHDVPFRQVHIHGLVRDAERQKMSKTRGNTIDPLVINEKYGTDAARFALLVSAAPGNDIALSEDRIAATRAFANKIWNASRLLFNKSGGDAVKASLADRWIASRLNACAEVTNRAFEQHRYHESADALWHFFWDEFCDWYLELKKLDADWGYAYKVYDDALRLLHPVMPFITEELWHRRGYTGSIALERYPQFDPAAADTDAEKEMKLLQEIVTAARAIRADHKVDKKQVLGGVLYCRRTTQIEAMERLANVKLELKPGPAPKLDGATRSTPDFDLMLRLPSAAPQKERLEKENEQLEKLIANSARQLESKEFLKKAPEKVVASIRAKKAEYEAQLAKNRAALAGG